MCKGTHSVVPESSFDDRARHILSLPHCYRYASGSCTEPAAWIENTPKACARLNKSLIVDVLGAYQPNHGSRSEPVGESKNHTYVQP